MVGKIQAKSGVVWRAFDRYFALVQRHQFRHYG